MRQFAIGVKCCMMPETTLIKGFLEKSLWRGILPHNLEVVEMGQLEDELKKTLEETPAWSEKENLLRSVPGVGPQTALVLLAELPELGACSRQQIAALVGVAPLNCDSGKRRGQRTTWGGRATVRSTLFMATLVATRHNHVIRAYYLHLQALGKRKKVALVACMRKLLYMLNAILREQKPWKNTASIT